jgi:hypothetical protein
MIRLSSVTKTATAVHPDGSFMYSGSTQRTAISLQLLNPICVPTSSEQEKRLTGSEILIRREESSPHGILIVSRSVRRKLGESVVESGTSVFGDGRAYPSPDEAQRIEPNGESAYRSGPGLAKRPRLEVEGRIRRTTVTIVNSEEGGVNLAIGGRLGLDRCFGVESRVLGSWREGKDGRMRVLHG